MKKRVNEISKICSACKIDKFLDEFHSESKGVLGKQSRCKECHKAAQRLWNSRQPDKIRVSNLKRLGITIEDYEKLIESQNGLCAVCGKPESKIDNRTGQIRRLAVDHDHSCCGPRNSCKCCIRGLLCQNCNQALGLLKENYQSIVSLADYVQKNPRFFLDTGNV